MKVPYKPPPLRLGSRGNPVLAVKRALKKAGHGKGLMPHGFYGANTVLNVRRFQKATGLTVDGQVGALTLKALEPFFDEYGYFLYTGQYPGVQPLKLPATFVPTHDTDGLPGFPAIDCFAAPYTPVLVPADGMMLWPHMIKWDHAKHIGGFSCYLQTRDATFYLAHFQEVGKPGRYEQGDTIGKVGAVPGNWWPSHIHEGRHVGRYDPL